MKKERRRMREGINMQSKTYTMYTLAIITHIPSIAGVS
jgi:hypothetical protein